MNEKKSCCCWFCKATPVAWTFHTPRMTVALFNVKTHEQSNATDCGPNWNACQACSDVILKRDAEGLWQRAVKAVGENAAEIAALGLNEQQFIEMMAMGSATIQSFIANVELDEPAPTAKPN